MDNSEVLEIKQKVDIVDLISSYVRLKKSGRHMGGLCPFHNEKSPSFMVSPELQIFKCFGCGKGGDVFSFIEEAEGLDFPGALQLLADRAGVKLKSNKMSPALEKKERLQKINRIAAEYFNYILVNHKIGDEARDYSKKRGITDLAIKKFGLGYSPRSWDSLGKYLIKKGFTEGEIISSGLALPKDGSRGYYDRFRGRLMFPIKDYSGRVLGFSGRALGESDQPKYMNSPESEIFKKGEVLFGLDLSKEYIKKEDSVIVTEGQLDMLTPFMAGTPNIVSSLGTALTSFQLKLLKRFTDNIILAFDTDSAGEGASKRGIELAEDAGMNVKILILPEGFKDPDECAKNDVVSWKKSVKNAKNIHDYFFLKAETKYDKNDSLGKKRIAGELLPIISKIGNEIVKAHYIKKLSSLLGIEDVTVEKELRKIRLLALETGASVEKAPRPKLSRKESLELSLIGIPLFLPVEDGRKILVNLDSADLTPTYNRVIFTTLVGYLEAVSGEVIIKDFYGRIPEEARNAFGVVYLLAEKDYSGRDFLELSKMLIKAKEEFEKMSTKDRIAQLSEKIKLLEKSGDKPELKKARQEFNELVLSIKKG